MESMQPDKEESRFGVPSTWYTWHLENLYTQLTIPLNLAPEKIPRPGQLLYSAEYVREKFATKSWVCRGFKPYTIGL